METEANGPFRWIPRSQKSKNDRKVVRLFYILMSINLPPILTNTVNHPPKPPSAPCNSVLTLTFTANPIVHYPTGHPRRPKATQVPTPTVVCRTVCVCVCK